MPLFWARRRAKKRCAAKRVALGESKSGRCQCLELCSNRLATQTSEMINKQNNRNVVTCLRDKARRARSSSAALCMTKRCETSACSSVASAVATTHTGGTSRCFNATTRVLRQAAQKKHEDVPRPDLQNTQQTFIPPLCRFVHELLEISQNNFFYTANRTRRRGRRRKRREYRT